MSLAETPVLGHPLRFGCPPLLLPVDHFLRAGPGPPARLCLLAQILLLFEILEDLAKPEVMRSTLNKNLQPASNLKL